MYQKNTDALLSAISWITAHGKSDQNKTVQEQTEKAMYSKLLLHCGAVSNWTQQLLTSLQIESRLVGGIELAAWQHFCWAMLGEYGLKHIATLNEASKFVILYSLARVRPKRKPQK